MVVCLSHWDGIKEGEGGELALEDGGGRGSEAKHLGEGRVRRCFIFTSRLIEAFTLIQRSILVKPVSPNSGSA